MAALTNILLATSNIEAFKGIYDQLNEAHIAFIDSEIPKYRMDGNLYCFIDCDDNLNNTIGLCSKIRSSPITSHAHITLSLREDTPRVQSMISESNANDWIFGHLTPENLVRKVEELGKCNPMAGHGPELTLGDLKIDPVAHKVSYKNRFIALNAMQFSLINYLSRRSDSILSKAELIDVCTKGANCISNKNFDIIISRMKKALYCQGVPNALLTLRTRGYVFDSTVFTGKTAS